MRYLFAALLSFAVADVAAAALPKPFPNPLASLKKGKVRFDCRMLGTDQGIGSHLMRFELALGKPVIDPTTKTVLTEHPLALVKVEQGELTPVGFPPKSMKAEYYPLDMDLSAKNPTVGGQILWPGTPNEQIYAGGHSSTQFKDTGVPGLEGTWLDQSFDLSQDKATKLVILRYTRTGVVDRGLPNCGESDSGCVARQSATRTEFVCEPRP